MTTAWDVFQMVALSDGTVLAAGGFNNGALSSSEVYTPITHWQSWAPTASTMINVRQQFQMVLLPDRTVLAAGGCYSVAAQLTAEIYNPIARAWAATAPMSTARAEYQIKVLTDGTALAAGGTAGTGFAYASSKYI